MHPAVALGQPEASEQLATNPQGEFALCISAEGVSNRCLHKTLSLSIAEAA